MSLLELWKEENGHPRMQWIKGLTVGFGWEELRSFYNSELLSISIDNCFDNTPLYGPIFNYNMRTIDSHFDSGIDSPVLSR